MSISRSKQFGVCFGFLILFVDFIEIFLPLDYLQERNLNSQTSLGSCLMAARQLFLQITAVFAGLELVKKIIMKVSFISVSFPVWKC